MVEFVKAIQEGKFICTECGKTESFMNVIENQDGTYICDKCLSMSAEHYLCDGCGAVLNKFTEGCHTVIDGDYCVSRACQSGRFFGGFKKTPRPLPLG